MIFLIKKSGVRSSLSYNFFPRLYWCGAKEFSMLIILAMLISKNQVKLIYCDLMKDTKSKTFGTDDSCSARAYEYQIWNWIRI